MKQKTGVFKFYRLCGIILVLVFAFSVLEIKAGDLPEIKKKNVIRHLGVPYANFVTGVGDGLDVELIQLFAGYLGVKYIYVKTDWNHLIEDLTGQKISRDGTSIKTVGQVPVKGDIIANGFTVLPWRQTLVDYSEPTFPTQVWLIARADSSMQPIHPSNNIDTDITMVMSMLKERVILGKANTCTDPDIYELNKIGAVSRKFAGSLNELAPAVINGEAEATILDVPDALVALEKWPGKIKVIGPISPKQVMGCGFAKTSPQLRAAFNDFFIKCKADGTYERLIKKYYPSVFMYFSEFFDQM